MEDLEEAVQDVKLDPAAYLGLQPADGRLAHADALGEFGLGQPTPLPPLPTLQDKLPVHCQGWLQLATGSLEGSVLHVSRSVVERPSSSAGVLLGRLLRRRGQRQTPSWT